MRDPFLAPLPPVAEIPVLSEIDHNLWQGRYPGPGGFEGEFVAILNLYPWESYATGEGVELRAERLYDSTDVPPAALLEELASWVNDRRSRGPVLVHCQAGLNRSGLVVGLALVRSGMTPDEAIARLRERRHPHVLFNRWFESWLRAVDTP